MNRNPAFVGASYPLRNGRKSTQASLWTCSIATKKDTIVSWNVNSLRALLRKQPDALKDLVRENDASVLCLQETKLRKEHEEAMDNLIDPEWTHVYNSSIAHLGYSGTAIFSERFPMGACTDIGHPAGDNEGRLAGMEYSNLFILSVYAMNSGEYLKRLPMRMDWDSQLRRYIRTLRADGKAVVVVGDFNVARNEMDVWDPEIVKGRAGYSDAERESFEDLLETCGMVDVFRKLNPYTNNSYTAWQYRTRARGRNRGMRLDYALVSDDMIDAVDDVRILDNVTGSDHCPVVIDLKKGMLQ